MTTQRPERRARTVAIAGLAFQMLLAAFFAVLWSWCSSEALRAVALLTAVGNVVWLFLVMVCHQRVLVQDETFETEQLRRERAGAAGTETIFDVADEQLLLARRRLRWMYRWLLPTFSLLLIGLLVLAGLWRWSWPIGQALSSNTWSAIDVEKTPLLFFLTLGAAFLSFLLSRYATGMSRYREWQILHAGATWLMGVTLAAGAFSLALGVLYVAKTPIPERVVAYVLRILLLVLAAETLLNLVLDFYRPRAPDEEPRPAFDSRLLGLFTEPGGIARSIADAINYQFGFEVSSTWFYKLLQRSVVPLIGFAVIMMFLLSSLLFVGANEVAVIERFGVKTRVVKDGLHVKWPWPIEKAYKVATGQVHDLRIGILEASEKPGQKELFLWTNQHSWEPHLNVLVATPKLAGVPTTRPMVESLLPTTQPGKESESRAQAVPVSQLRISAAMQFKIRDRDRDVYDWLRRYGGAKNEGPLEVLSAVARREIMRQCASVDVAGLMGTQRGETEQRLREEIQRKANELNLGVDIVFLGLQGVHPPLDTAESFQNVIGAESKKTASERSAWADRNRRLAEIAGDVTRAENLSKAIRRLTELESEQTVPKDELQAARDRVNRLFFGDNKAGVAPIGGQAATKVAKARAERWRLENRAQGQATGFDYEMATKNAAPKLYRMRKYLEMLADATAAVRKYVIAASEAGRSLRTFGLNLQDERDIPLGVTPDQK
jgi:modulator of FtsH protease HflK